MQDYLLRTENRPFLTKNHMDKIKKYKIKVNNLEKIEELLQETYDLACKQQVVIQSEMNKISVTTKVNDLDIEGKEKYAKAMQNYISLQQKSISQKMDIAKLMSEIVKNNGDAEKALKGMKSKNTTLDLEKLRNLAKEASTGYNDTQIYNVK